MKKLVSILFTVMLMSIFLPSVFAEENEYTYAIDSLSASLTSSGQKLTATVTNLSDRQTDDLLIAAAYSYENELLNFNSLPLSLDPLETDNIKLSITADSNDISYIKVFIWDSFETLTPLSGECTVTPTKPLDFAVLLSVKNDNIKLLLDNGLTKSYTASESTLSSAQDILNSGATAKDRIVTYKVDSVTGEIVTVTKAAENSAVDTINVNLETYKTRTARLGTHDISDDTVIIDATFAEKGLDKYWNYAVSDKTGLTDGEDYTGYVFKQDECTSLVLITKIGVEFDEDARFAVIQDDAMLHYTDDDEECELVVALTGGRSGQEMFFKTGDYEEYDLGIGDAFFYTQNSAGFVDTVYKVYDHSEGTVTKLSDIMDKPMFKESDWSYNLWDEGDPIQLTTGAVIEVTDSYISLASLEQIKTGSLDTNQELDNTQGDGIVTYGIADDAVAYVYDADSDEYKESKKYKAKDVSSVKASKLSDFEIEAGVYENIDMSKVNEALVMIVDGEIVEIYVIEK